MSFLGLPDTTSTASSSYQDAVRARFADLEHHWRPVSITTDDGQSLELEMSEDAVKLDGIRINGTANFQREVGDLLEGYLMTPRLVDVLFLAAEKQIPPQPHRTSGTPQMDDVGPMLEHSQKVDELAGSTRFIADPCKDYVELENGGIRNYGWHTSPAISKSMGIPAQPAITPGMYVVQRPYNHGLEHSDYSQCMRFVRKRARFNGRTTDLRLLMNDPTVQTLVYKPVGTVGGASGLIEPPQTPPQPPAPEPPQPGAPPPAAPPEAPPRRPALGFAGFALIPLVGLGAVLLARGAR